MLGQELFFVGLLSGFDGLDVFGNDFVEPLVAVTFVEPVSLQGQHFTDVFGGYGVLGCARCRAPATVIHN